MTEGDGDGEGTGWVGMEYLNCLIGRRSGGLPPEDFL